MEGIFNTDLACESYLKEDNGSDNNAEYFEYDLGYCTLIRQKVFNDRQVERCDYVTIFCDKINLLDEYCLALISGLVCEELITLIKNKLSVQSVKNTSFLIAGLGNIDFTADSLGPRTVEMIMATRHLNQKEFPSVSIIVPSVLSKSGIETVDFVREIAEYVSPDLLIVIDALSAGNCERLGKTIQISSAGIGPGSGVRNAQAPLNEKTVGIPVISIGIPTVVDSATLVIDVLEKAGIKEIDKNLFSVLNDSKSFFVTPKETDEIINASAKLISKAINTAFGIS